MHHYTESGLPYVWLANGYRVEQTLYGKALIVEDADALHRAIARWIVAHRPRLAGREVKFLRLEMDCTQAELAKRLGLTEQAVSLWERQPARPCPATADRLLRVLVEAWLDGRQPVAQAIRRIGQAAGAKPVTQPRFERRRSTWRAAA